MTIRKLPNPQSRLEQYLLYIIEHGIGGGTNSYLSLKRLGSYLYEVTFDKLPEENDADYFVGGGCTSYVKDGKLYRNLDFDYSEIITFKVKCNGFEGTAFSKELVEGNLNEDAIGQLPYHLTDGRNDHGIMVSEHILYNDWNWHSSGEGNIPLDTVPYLILSRVKNLDNFATQIVDIIGNLAATPALNRADYLLQFLVTDGTTTYAILPPTTSTGSYVVADITANPKLTNFRWVSDKTVNREDLQTRPTGVERWNIAPSSLGDLRFTKAYQSPTRLSEFIGIDGTTKNSTDAELMTIYNKARAIYLNRMRDGQTWQTMYSVVYSAYGVEALFTQENYNWNYAQSGDSDRLRVQVESDTVAGIWDVPNMTVQNVIDAHKALAAGKSVSIVNSAGEVTFAPFLADISTGRPCITIAYYWLGFVDYQVTSSNTVAITVHEICLREPTNYVTFTAQQENSSVKIEINGTLSPISLFYSTDNLTWQPYTINTVISLASVGDYVSFYGVGNWKATYSSSNYLHFVMTGKIAGSGDCNALLDTSLDTTVEYGYCRMFDGCTSLTQAPELPATKLSDHCYFYMFDDCTSLTQAPELPATTLADYCYESMFSGCTSLTQAPELPATTLASYCYYNMFSGCASLTQAPELPATTLASYCYYNMFSGCTSLTQAPELPAITLAGQCYESMFKGCTSLTQAPDLPATTLMAACYCEMFKGCTSLTQAPDLPATIMTYDCYDFMFEGCTSLTSVKISVSTWNKTHASGWLSRVAATGTVYCPTDSTIPSNDPSGIPTGWSRVDWAPAANYVTFTAQQENSSVKIEINGTLSPISLFYSTDNLTWQPYTINTVISLASVGDYVSFYGVGNWKATYSSSNYLHFVMTGKLAGSGDCNALLDTSLDTTVEHGCCSMFDGCTSLTQAPELPATALSNYCYRSMFYGCTSLTQAPELPATALANYCYYFMFSGCTSLAQAPELPATTLADGCYSSMFKGCTSLTQAPELPATTLAGHCYESMFHGCASLTQAPELPATMMVIDCYMQMFTNCASLTSVKISIYSWNRWYTTGWLSGVAATGTVYCPTDSTIPSNDVSGIPTGWTRVDWTPAA